MVMFQHVDEIVQDSEVGMETFELMDWFGPPATNETSRACEAERWETIASDPRWPPILKKLLARGFDAGPNPDAEGAMAAAMSNARTSNSQAGRKSIGSQCLPRALQIGHLGPVHRQVTRTTGTFSTAL